MVYYVCECGHRFGVNRPHTHCVNAGCGGKASPFHSVPLRGGLELQLNGVDDTTHVFSPLSGERRLIGKFGCQVKVVYGKEGTRITGDKSTALAGSGGKLMNG